MKTYLHTNRVNFTSCEVRDLSHHFDFRTKGWIVAGMLLLITTALSAGLSGYLWTENNRLQAADTKYRLLRQVALADTKWADSVYTSDPGETKNAC